MAFHRLTGRKNYDAIPIDDFKTISNSWNMIKYQMSGFGLLWFTLFLEDFPKYGKYFTFANHFEFERHAFTVMCELSKFIKVIYIEPNLSNMIKKISDTHFDLNIELQVFDDLRRTFLKALSLKSKGLQESEAAAIRESWDKVLKVFFTSLYNLNPVTTALPETLTEQQQHHSRGYSVVTEIIVAEVSQFPNRLLDSDAEKKEKRRISKRKQVTINDILHRRESTYSTVTQFRDNK